MELIPLIARIALRLKLETVFPPWSFLKHGCFLQNVADIEHALEALSSSTVSRPSLASLMSACLQYMCSLIALVRRQLSDLFSTGSTKTSSFRQGCPLSPLLFVAATRSKTIPARSQLGGARSQQAKGKLKAMGKGPEECEGTCWNPG